MEKDKLGMYFDTYASSVQKPLFVEKSIGYMGLVRQYLMGHLTGRD